MRTTMTLVLAVLLSLGFAVTSFAGIVNSAHDLSTGTTGMEAEVCVYCHTPHNAIEYETDNSYPLWSMTETALTTNFTEYTSVTLDGAMADTLAGPSRLCMSCHDGIIAMDNAVNGDLATRTMGAMSDSNLGQDLTNDHPVGMVYDVALDGELFPTTNTFVTAADQISDYLYEGLVTCASCHDVHTPDPDNPAATARGTFFLLVNNDGSALCLKCHDK